MTTLTKAFARKNGIVTGADWDIAFWFAVLSPLIEILVGLLALLLFYR